MCVGEEGGREVGMVGGREGGKDRGRKGGREGRKVFLTLNHTTGQFKYPPFKPYVEMFTHSC